MKEKNEQLLSLGRRIQAYRERAGLSQEKLAERANVHRTYIGTVERGETNLTVLNLLKIAAALNVNVNKLLCQEE